MGGAGRINIRVWATNNLIQTGLMAVSEDGRLLYFIEPVCGCCAEGPIP